MTGGDSLRADGAWRNIWEKKGTQEVDVTGLGGLLIYGGFDSVSSKTSKDSYRRYAESLCSKVGLCEKDRVLEIGCGAGAFLHCLKPPPAEIVGIDYSRSLIFRAEKLKSNSGIRFYQAEAANLKKLGLGRFDVIFSNSVFFYFPSLKYAAQVCRQIVQSLNRSGRIAILDVADATKKEQFLQMRYAEVGEARYKQLYKDLDSLFFERGFFLETFRALGCPNISIEDQSWEGYGNSPYRFNVFVWT